MKKHYINKILPGNRTTLRVLKLAIIRGGALVATDLDQWVFIENEYTRDEANAGNTYDLPLLKTAADFKTGRCQGAPPDEFPTLEVPGTAEFLPLEIAHRLPDFAPYCSTDYTTRVSLTGIYVDLSEGVLAATSGHVIREGRLSTSSKSKGHWILPVCASAFIKAMCKETLLSAEIVDNYFKLVYAGRDTSVVTYYAKVVEGPYLDYKRCLPGKSGGKIIPTTEVMRKAVHDGIKRLQAYGKGYSRGDPIIFKEGVLTWNGVDGFKTLRGLPVILESTPCQFSATLLLRVLRDVRGDVRVQSFENPLRPAIFYSQQERFAVYPLRPGDSDEWPPVGDDIGT